VQRSQAGVTKLLQLYEEKDKRQNVKVIRFGGFGTRIVFINSMEWHSLPLKIKSRTLIVKNNVRLAVIYF